MTPNTTDGQSQAVYLVLVILGIMLAVAGWLRWAF
jgi:uncharacterized membrane protein YidH (DUF202 family)